MDKISRISLASFIGDSANWIEKQPEFYELNDFDSVDMDQLRVEFMRLSPSYALACDLTLSSASKHKVFKTMFPVVNDAKSGNEVRQSTDEVIRARFKGIETVYKEYGDINTSIFDWYRNIGRHIFDNWENRRDVQFLGVLNGVDEKDQSNLKIKKRTQQYIEMISGDGERPKTMLLAIPFDLPKSIALKHVQTLIDAHYDWILEIEDIEYRKKKPLASKRERPDALIRKLKVLICKAFHPNMPLWKIGLISGISSKHDYRMSDKKLSDDEKIALRPEIATLTSRALRQGQYIAEHAALDSFPVTDKIKIPIYEWDVVKARILLAYPKLKVFDSLAEYY